MPANSTASTKLDIPAGLLEFQTRRKESTRSRLLKAAATLFGEQGYLPVSVEEIALAAGISRMTFYRHFGGKAEIASALFRANAAAQLPMIAAIGTGEFRDLATVTAWIGGIFAADRQQRAILQAFIQANVVEAGFAEEGHAFIDEIVTALGANIPAFAPDAEVKSDRRRRVEAALIIYEILDQSNHAARNMGVAVDHLLVDVLAKRFVAFVTR